jgi:hypothetical protein
MVNLAYAPVSGVDGASVVNTAGVAYYPPNPPPFPPPPPPRGRGRGWRWVIALIGGPVLIILFVVIVVNATKSGPSGPSSAPGAAESYAFGHDRIGPGVARLARQLGSINVPMMCDAEIGDAKIQDRLPDPWVYDEGMRGCKDYVTEDKRTGD